MKHYFLILFAFLILLGCENSSDKPDYNSDQEHLVTATLWFQNSPEAKSLYYQGFNLAKERVLEYKDEKGSKPKAVVVDLDETMIDNSSFQGKMIETGKRFSPDFWAEWSSKQKSTAMPGAADFTNFCDSVGVEIIYISNRAVTELEWTMNNLEALGFAFVKPENFILMESTSGKEPRRESASEKYDIILLLGDNLNDFSDVFESRGDDWGLSVVHQYREEFGRRFIVFPNPMYGEWEKSIYQNKRGAEEPERFKMRRKAIKSY